MSFRSVAEHALGVYYDGDQELARKVLDGYAHELAERQREYSRAEGMGDHAEELADLIDPERAPDAPPA